MRLLQPFYCLFGKHHRSRSRAWYDGLSYHSWCEGCGRPMVRGMRGWSIAPKTAPTGKHD